MAKVVVTGAGGFVGNHLVVHAKAQGHYVVGVDVRYPLWSETTADEFLLLDLRYPGNAIEAFEGAEIVFALAADMGGMAFIADKTVQAEMGHNNAMIGLSCLTAARHTPTIEHYLFTSSVCVYPTEKLSQIDVAAMAETEAIPANPQGIYGWEKLWTERMCLAYRQQYGLNTHIVRLQNTFGTMCEWRDEKDDPRGHRTKAPAAIARKVAVASLTGNHDIEVWGDGKATRTFMYVKDCVRGIYLVGTSDYNDPVTLGPDRVIDVDTLVRILAHCAQITPNIVHVAGPEGVRGRNFDHTVATSLGWKPAVSLENGLCELYRWVYKQVEKEMETK